MAGPQYRQKLQPRNSGLPSLRSQPKEKDSIISYDIGKNFNYPIEVDSFKKYLKEK